MSQNAWIAFTVVCAVGLAVMIPFLIVEMSREAQRDAMEK